MASPTTVPMIDPDGNLGDVPQEQMKGALDAGGKLAIPMIGPDGSKSYVPHDQVDSARKAGAKVDAQATETPTLMDTIKKSFSLDNITKNAVQGLKELVPSFKSTPLGPLAGPVSMGASAVGQAVKAKEDFSKGDVKGIVSGTGHAAAAALPLVGPYAASLGEQAGGGDVGGAAARGGVQALAGEAIRVLPKVVEKGALLGKTPPEAYESALKPATTIPAAKRAAIVETGLKEGIPVSAKGAEKLSALIDDVNDKMDKAIPANTTGTVNKYAVASRLSDTANTFSKQATPTADLNAVSDAGNDFLNSHPGQIPATDAAAIKTGTYRQIGAKGYGELGTASKEAQKALARGIKEELIQQFPELEQLGQKDKRLLDLQPVLERAVNRVGNHQLVGLGTPVTAAGMKALTGSNKIAAVAAIMKAVVDNPTIKSRIAIALNRGGLAPALATQRVSRYIGALSNPQSAAQSPDQSTTQQP